MKGSKECTPKVAELAAGWSRRAVSLLRAAIRRGALSLFRAALKRALPCSRGRQAEAVTTGSTCATLMCAE